MAITKVGTCCYCGTKAALVLTGKLRHELACSTCGAPLSQMKMLRKEPVRVTAPAAAPTHPRLARKPQKSVKSKRNKPKKKSKFSKLRGKMFEELWDVVEDIFD